MHFHACFLPYSLFDAFSFYARFHVVMQFEVIFFCSINALQLVCSFDAFLCIDFPPNDQRLCSVQRRRKSIWVHNHFDTNVTFMIKEINEVSK